MGSEKIPLEVILVDDEAERIQETYRAMLQPLLAAGEISFKSFDNPRIAVEYIAKRDPALVLLDQEMGIEGFRGEDVLERIKGAFDSKQPLGRDFSRDERFEKTSTQVIFLSGYKLDAALLMEKGARTVLQKAGFSDIELQRYVRGALIEYVAQRDAKLNIERLNGIVRQKTAAYREVIEARSSPEAAKIIMGEIVTPRIGKSRVTTIFADLVSYTTYAEDMRQREENTGFQEGDPHTSLIFQLNEHFSALKAIVEPFHYGVFKTIGDEVMVGFGVPKERKSDHLRAGYCALKMREYNKIKNKDGTWLDLSIGLETGVVDAGVFEASKEFDIIGDPVNTAKRICTLAGRNQIYVGEATAKALQEYFHIDFKGKTKVKGKEIPVTYYELDNLKNPFELEGRMHLKKEWYDRLNFWNDETRAFEEDIARTMTKNPAWFLEQGIREGILYRERTVALYSRALVDIINNTRPRDQHLDKDMLRTLAYVVEMGRYAVPFKEDYFGKPDETLTEVDTQHIHNMASYTLQILGGFNMERERRIIEDFYGNRQVEEAVIIDIAQQYDYWNRTRTEESGSSFRESLEEIHEQHPDIVAAVNTILP